MQRQRDTTRLGNTRELPRRASSTAAVGLPAPSEEEASAAGLANGHMRRQSLSFTGMLRFHLLQPCQEPVATSVHSGHWGQDSSFLAAGEHVGTPDFVIKRYGGTVEQGEPPPVHRRGSVPPWTPQRRPPREV